MNNDSVEKKSTKQIAVITDGLDGSGKSRTSEEIANILRASEKFVVKIKYPQYNTGWGKFIKSALNDPECDLNLEERMAIYAINRLESIDKILSICSELEDCILVFDRFSTSNIITLSYYLAQGELKDCDETEVKKYLLNNHEMIVKYLRLMIEIDSDFLEISRLKESQVVVLAIDPEISMGRLKGDSTRDGLDQYEDLKVQKIASEIYKIASKIKEFNIHILEQDGVNPDQLARKVIGFFAIDIDPEIKDSGVIQIINLSEGEVFRLSDRVQNAINKLLSKYQKLKLLNITKI